MSPTRRHQAVVMMLQERLALSERRACRAIGQPRCTQRLRPREIAPEEERLRAPPRELARDHPRYGYRMMTAILRREGYPVNHKRIQRLCRDEGLRVVHRAKKRSHVRVSSLPARRLSAEHPDHVWALDCQFVQTREGRVLKFLNITDEFTREALAIVVRRSIDADATVAVLDDLVEERGTAPRFIRCDNGPELTANALRDWCRFSCTRTSYMDPGSPWQNPFVESFNSRLRDELLTVELFESLLEAHVLAEVYRVEYYTWRPHSSLGSLAPVEFAKDLGHQPNVGLTRGSGIAGAPSSKSGALPIPFLARAPRGP